MTIGARLETSDVANLRGYPRHLLHLSITTSKPNGPSAQALIHNISETGLLLESSANLEIGETLAILLPHREATTAVVMWASDGLSGCKFTTPLSRSALSAALLQSAPAHDGQFAQRPTHAGHGEGTPGSAEALETFGSRLRRLRLARSFTLTALAKAVGVSKPTLWKWENDDVRPRQKSLDRLRATLGVSERELLTGKWVTVEQPVTVPITPSLPSSLAGTVEECKERIAELAGTHANNVTITLRY
ncbi:PilZ domain-containing protein [Sphingopyxis sp. YR583]|uniref:helix-turn-helix domain-containing protein n=1 Tax=Sphingopyxis sp. YR583 TaxID=1881047 RepID=UPI0008A79F3B|nr:helix-turn-helix domain-containing protein [Sphingopyxis sp. YR583]SEH20090.1 PilZ domain-containing protein [Sphingopyxis sp. YR583]